MNLTKNDTVQLIDLSKGTDMPVFKLGASWGKIKRNRKKLFGFLGGVSSSESVDLDLCSFGISNGKIVKECSYRHPSCSYMRSSGDDRSGGVTDGDNEIITLDMSKVPTNIDTIVMIINSYSGQKFDEIPFAKIRVYEGQDNVPKKTHCEYNVSSDRSFVNGKTLVIGSIFRSGNGWDFKAIGEIRTYKSIDSFKEEAENA